MGDRSEGRAKKRNSGSSPHGRDEILEIDRTPMGGLYFLSIHGIEVEVLREWVPLLRRHAMPWTAKNRGSPLWPGMDFATVVACLYGGEGENPDTPAVLGWLRSGIPIDRAEHYLAAGLSVEEAHQHEADGSYDEQSLRLMAALRSKLKDRP